MRLRLAACMAMLLFGATPADAHRLDEYLQATTFMVGKDRVEGQIRLLPGVAVFSTVVSAADVNADGVLSDAEQRAFALKVLADLELAVDGRRTPLSLITWKFASVAELKEGRGVIEVDFEAMPPQGSRNRRLTFVNHHRPRMSEYLVNALVPREADIHIAGQSRSYDQSRFELKYDVGASNADATTPAWWSEVSGWLIAVGLLSLARLVHFFLARRRRELLRGPAVS